jgi:transposase InsO family protein
VPRSTFYRRRRSAAAPRAAAKRGPRTGYTDQELTGEIAQSIVGPPFHGEGHRKVWARLRLAGVRTSKRRVLRLMREHGFLAPGRQPQPVKSKRHDGTILAERPNKMWGIDATAGFTAQDGQVAIFAMVDHYSAYCLGIHAAKRGTRFEALEPVRQAVQERLGGFGEAVAAGVRLRHDHGSQCMSADFQAELRFLEMESSPAFLRGPESNGYLEIYNRRFLDECLNANGFLHIGDAKQKIEQCWMEYIEERPHSSLAYNTPREYAEACSDKGSRMAEEIV